MTLVPFTGVTSASTLNDNFDDKTSTLTENAKAGQKDQMINLRVLAVGSGTDLSARSMLFIPQDDVELRIITVKATDALAARVITMLLEQADGDSKFLMDVDVSAAVTTVNGSATTRVDFRTTTGNRLRLLRGVQYRLSVSSDTAGTTTAIQAGLQLRTKRRVA